MQPWIEKASSSSDHKSSLNYDKTLSHLSNSHHPMSSQQQSSSSTMNGFRTLSFSSRDMNTEQYTNNDFSNSGNVPTQSTPFQSYNFSPVYTSSNMMSLSDGSDILNFLNSTSYSENIYGDDLSPDSISYISHRHQADTQHALAESERLLSQWTELMVTDDIVEYLSSTNYTDDVYGIPVIGKMIKEAKKEVMEDATSSSSKKAIERLSMMRNHLVENAFK